MLRRVDRSDEVPYEYASPSSLREGDEVIDHRPDGSGDKVKYRIEMDVVDDRCEHEYRYLGDSCVDVLCYLDGALINLRSFLGNRFRCTVTGEVFVTGEAAAGSPRICPECGADATSEGVNNCTDAYACEDSQDGAHGAQGDAQDARDHRTTNSHRRRSTALQEEANNNGTSKQQ